MKNNEEKDGLSSFYLLRNCLREEQKKNENKN